MQRTEISAGIRACRVVTTSMTARLLLAGQLGALSEISWSIVSGDAFDDPPAHVAVDEVPVRREFALSDLGALAGLWRYFRRQRFDFVQTHTPKASFLGLPAARLSGTTAIYTIHGSLYFRDNGRIANIMGWLFERWCCAWANLVLVQSREDEQVLPEARICRARKIRYVGNGIDLERFSETVGDATAAPGRSGRTIPRVLMVSRLVREKGCTDFIHVARVLEGRAVFVHVGPVEHDQSDALTNDDIAAASRFVNFVGVVDDIRPHLASSDVVVLPSYREGIPRVAMEAAAAGKPVVGYDVRGVREVLDPSSGLLVKRGDQDGLADVVGRLVADPEARARLGRSCRARVLERFSEDAVVERLRAVYSELAAT